MNVCIVMSLFRNPEAAHDRVVDVLRWLEPLCEEVFIIGGHPRLEAISNLKIHVTTVRYQADEQTFSKRSVKQFFLQLYVSCRLIKPALHSQVIIFWLTGAFALPMLIAKLLRKKTMLFATGSFAEGVRGQYRSALRGFLAYYMTRALERVTYSLADRILLLSESLEEQVKQIAGSRCLSKTSICLARPIDAHLFSPSQPLEKRKNLVAYVGRIDKDKGVIDFIRALPLLQSSKGNMQFMIVGDGPLTNDIKKFARENNLLDAVEFVGWISPNKVPQYLNKIKLLVLPSYREGLPRIVLEAMACDTPVLATLVGGLPSIIKDEETGFVLKDSSPQAIAQGIERALNHPQLGRIVESARRLIEKEYSYEALTERYKEILKS